MNAFSQVKIFEIGKIGIEELTKSNHPDAPAVILAKISNLEIQELDGFMVTHKNYVRLKIQDSSAFERANFVFDYYHKDGYERVRNIKGVITYPNGIQYQLKNSDIDRKRIDRDWTRVSFNYPDLVEGSIIEYSYTINVSDVFPLEDFVFQYDIPVEYAEFTFNIEKVVEYDFEIINEALLEPIRYGFVGKNIPAIKPDALIDNLDNYKGRIITYIDRINYNSDKISLTTEWEVHARNLLTFEYFGNQIGEKKFSNRLSSNFKEIIAEDISNKEKILKLTKALTEKVSWNGIYDIYAEKSLDEAYIAELANSGELNLMMATLLKDAEIAFVPVLVRLRGQGNVSIKSKDLDQFTHMILLTEIDGETLFIDVQDKYKSPFMVREEALNKVGFVVLEDPVWVKIEPEPSKQTHVAEFVLDNQGIKGVINSRFEGYSAYYERSNVSVDSLGNFWERRLRTKFPRTYVSNLEYDNMENIDEKFTSKVNIEISDAYEIFKDTLFLDPVLWSNFPENPFELSERNYAVNLAYPFEESYVYTLSLPESYEIVNLPESIQVATENGDAEFRFSCDIVNGKIQLYRILKLDKSIYSADYYPALYSIFQKLDTKSKEKLILVKK